MEKSRVLILVNHDIVIYNFRRELVESLLSKDYEIYISSPYGDQIEKLIDMGAKYIQTNVDRRGLNPFRDLKLLLKYRKIITMIKPSVLLTYTIKPNIYGGIASRWTHTPFIPNITGLGTAVDNKGFLQKVLILLYKFALKEAYIVYFQNKENLSFMIENDVVKTNFFVLPGSGVNLDYFHPLPYPKYSGSLHFLFVGRFLKEKGIGLYIDAAKVVKQKFPNVVFHVIGFGEESYVNVLKEFHSKRLIEFHGKQDDIRTFLKNVHCLIHPSYYPEGISNVLLESAACARPIITTDRSGCREVVNCNKNGLVTKPNDLDDLIQKIIQFIELPYSVKRNMGAEGRKYVEDKFDRKLVVNEYMRSISKIVER